MVTVRSSQSALISRMQSSTWRWVIVLGLLLFGIGLFRVGRVPGRNLIETKDAESYIIAGKARAAIDVTALVEFLLGLGLGLAIVPLVRCLRRHSRVTLTHTKQEPFPPEGS